MFAIIYKSRKHRGFLFTKNTTVGARRSCLANLLLLIDMREISSFINSYYLIDINMRREGVEVIQD